MRFALQLLLNVIFAWPLLWAAYSRWGKWSRESKQNRQSTGTQGFKRILQTHRESRRSTWQAGRQCGVSVCLCGGRARHIQKYVASCISHQGSSSSSSSSTWTEPPSRSAVRCDPRVSLLVTGVGWDSLPLGSGDLMQRAKRVEAGGSEVVRRRRRRGGRRLWECGVWGGEGRGRTRRRGVNENKKKETKQKNYRRHLPSRSRLVKKNYVNRSRGKQKFMRSTDQHTNKVMQE